MTDITHLITLQQRLARELMRLAEAKDSKEVHIREVYIRQVEKEIQNEKSFLGLDTDLPSLTEDGLMAELRG